MYDISIALLIGIAAEIIYVIPIGISSAVLGIGVGLAGAVFISA